MDGNAGTPTTMLDNVSTPQLHHSSTMASALPSPRKAFLSQRSSHFRKQKSVPSGIANKPDRNVSITVSNGGNLLQSPANEYLERRIG